MVQITSLVGVLALVSTMVHGLPRPIPEDSAIGLEVGVSAPNGIPMTDTAELSSQLSREAATMTAAEPMMTSGSEMKSSEMKSSGCMSPECMPEKASMPAKEGSGCMSGKCGMEESKTTMMAEPAKITMAEQPKYTTPSYGSGSSNWNSNEYEDCVQQCVAKFSSPLGEYKPTATSKEEATGTGATHTVVVAPSQGVLRYVPFALNASVGDTVKFMWGANNHSVTKSSSLLPCNTSSDDPFDSKVQLINSEFTHVVTSTEPTFFRCTVGVHCQKGMFGIINPASGTVSESSVSANLQLLAANSSSLMGYMALTQKATANNEAASKWGGSIDLKALPEWSHQVVAENVLYTRNFLAANPEVLKDDGSIDLGTSAPLAVPLDMAAALNSAGSGTTPSASTAAAPTPSAEATENPAGNASNLNTNGAASLSSSKMVVVALAGVATYFLL